MKKAFLLLLLALWILGCWWWYSCRHCGCCGSRQAPQTVAAAEMRPIVFGWSDAKPITGARFPGFRDSLLRAVHSGDTLLISGRYFDGETATAGFANPGLARAAQVAQLFQQAGFPANRIRSAALPAGAAPPGAQQQLFEAADFAFIPVKLTPGEVTVVEEDTMVSAYFPTGSAKKVEDPKVVAALDRLAAKHKDSPARFLIVGHTDSTGTDKLNQKLGQDRADAMKTLMIKRGLSAGRIQTRSAGSSQPVAGNQTDEGRMRNRRAEIVIQN